MQNQEYCHDTPDHVSTKLLTQPPSLPPNISFSMLMELSEESAISCPMCLQQLLQYFLTHFTFFSILSPIIYSNFCSVDNDMHLHHFQADGMKYDSLLIPDKGRKCHHILPLFRQNITPKFFETTKIMFDNYTISCNCCIPTFILQCEYFSIWFLKINEWWNTELKL